MGQITHGIRSILDRPQVYDLLQFLMGARACRIQLSERFIQAQPGHKVLDLGCGTAETLAYLPSAIEYFGFDISSEYIEAARKRFGTRGNFEARLLTDADLATLPRFDRVLCVCLLHHLDDDEAVACLQLARNAMAPEGACITLDPVYVKGQHPVAKWLIDRDRGQNVRSEQEYLRLAQQVFGQVESTIDHRAWVPYTHCIMRCRG